MKTITLPTFFQMTTRRMVLLVLIGASALSIGCKPSKTKPKSASAAGGIVPAATMEVWFDPGITAKYSSVTGPGVALAYMTNPGPTGITVTLVGTKIVGSNNYSQHNVWDEARAGTTIDEVGIHVNSTMVNIVNCQKIELYYNDTTGVFGTAETVTTRNRIALLTAVHEIGHAWHSNATSSTTNWMTDKVSFVLPAMRLPATSGVWARPTFTGAQISTILSTI